MEPPPEAVKIIEKPVYIGEKDGIPQYRINVEIFGCPVKCVVPEKYVDVEAYLKYIHSTPFERIIGTSYSSEDGTSNDEIREDDVRWSVGKIIGENTNEKGEKIYIFSIDKWGSYYGQFEYTESEVKEKFKSQIDIYNKGKKQKQKKDEAL